MARDNQLAVIHILKAKYEMSAEEYESMLYENFQTFSSKDLTEEDRAKFIHLINMKYSEDYKYGYNYCLNKFVCKDSISTFKALHPQYTQYELDMFEMLDENQRKEVLQKFIK